MFHRNKFFLGVTLVLLAVGGFMYFFPSYIFAPVEIGNTTLENKKCLADDNSAVVKVIDGDTIIVDGGYHVRLLGIDTDEKGELCYEQAKARLAELVLGKQVRLEKDITDVDQYNRCLRNVFLGDYHINMAMVKEGLASAMPYGPDIKYQDEINDAEVYAMGHKVGCKWSK